MTIYSRSSIQNTNNKWFRIWKNKCIIEFNKQPARYYKSSYNNNKFKISARTWNNKFELPDGSYSVSDIQDYFDYILKKHGEDIDKTSV